MLKVLCIVPKYQKINIRYLKNLMLPCVSVILFFLLGVICQPFIFKQYFLRVSGNLEPSSWTDDESVNIFTVCAGPNSNALWRKPEHRKETN